MAMNEPIIVVSPLDKFFISLHQTRAFFGMRSSFGSPLVVVGWVSQPNYRSATEGTLVLSNEKGNPLSRDFLEKLSAAG